MYLEAWKGEVDDKNGKRFNQQTLFTRIHRMIELEIIM